MKANQSAGVRHAHIPCPICRSYQRNEIAIIHCSATTCISHWPRVGVYKMRKALRRNDTGQSTKVLKQSAASLIAESHK